jgi:hypothetical protein
MSRAQPRIFSDAEIFFTAVLGLSLVLLGNDAVLTVAAGDPDKPSLLSRLCLPTTIAPFWVFFVLLPSALGFIAIGVPYALRTLIALVRKKLESRNAVGVLALLLVAAAAFFELLWGRSGRISLAAAAGVGIWQVWPALAGVPRKRGTRMLGVAGGGLGGLAYYERALAMGAEPSMAVAPTCYVTAFFFGTLGILLVSAGLAANRGRLAAVAAWLGAALFFFGSRATTALAGNADPATIEWGGTAVAAAMLLAVFLANEFRSD